MLNFTVKNLINACQNGVITIEVYRITANTCAYDPEEETELLCKVEALNEIEPEIQDAEVQDFYADNTTLQIYID